MEVCAAEYIQHGLKDDDTSSSICTLSGMVRCTLIIHVTSVQSLGTTVNETALGTLGIEIECIKQAELSIAYWLSRRCNCLEAQPKRP